MIMDKRQSKLSQFSFEKDSVEIEYHTLLIQKEFICSQMQKLISTSGDFDSLGYSDPAVFFVNNKF